MQTQEQLQKSIIDSVQANPKLAFDPNYISMYQKAGGTLSNYSIPNQPKPVSTVGVLSTPQGVNTVNQKQATLSNLSPVTTSPTSNVTAETPTTTKDTPPSGTKTPTTSFTLEDAMKVAPKTADGKTDMTGWKQGADGNWIPDSTALAKMGVVTTPVDTAQQKAEADKIQAEADLKAQTDKFNSYMISDTALQAQTDAITNQWNARIADMERVNKARTSSINTSGIRLGSRYDVAGAGDFGGIVTEEERQGVARIGELEGQKQSAIAAARTAALTHNWTVFSRQVDLSMKLVEQKQKALDNLNTATVERNKEIALQLKNQNEVNAKVLAEKTKNINEVLTSARKNNAPTEVIKSIQDVLDSGGEVSDAVNVAGQYGTEASGILGEYYQYKREGGNMDWQSYKNWDDNNKARVQAIVDQAGLNKEQRTRIYALIDDYDRQVKDIKTVLTQSKNIQALGTNALSTNKDAGTRAASQIGLIFSFMKVLDPSSTVREGEYATAQNTAGVEDRIRNAYNKALDGSFLTDGQIKGYMTTAESLAEVRRRNKEEIDIEFDRRAVLSDIPKGTITGANDPIKTEQDTEKQAEDALTIYLASNPDKADEMNTRIARMEKSLGRSITSAEFLQAFPEYK